MHPVFSGSFQAVRSWSRPTVVRRSGGTLLELPLPPHPGPGRSSRRPQYTWITTGSERIGPDAAWMR